MSRPSRCPCVDRPGGHTFFDHTPEERLLLAIFGNAEIKTAMERHLHRDCGPECTRHHAQQCRVCSPPGKESV